MSDEFDQLDRLIIECQVRALVLLRELFVCSLHEALDLFAARYEKLRQTRPDEFILSRDEMRAIPSYR